MDFGCGDGFYSMYLSGLFKNFQFFGCDLSQEFINYASKKAQEKSMNCIFKQGESTIPFESKFDIIFCIAVLAHIPPEQLKGIVKQFRQKSCKGAKVILFEQTALIAREGSTWARRTEGYYERLFDTNGFKLLRKELISFPFFTLASKYARLPFLGLAVLTGKLRLDKLSQYLRNPNHRFLVICYEIFMVLTHLFDRFLIPKEGNTLFIFETE